MADNPGKAQFSLSTPNGEVRAVSEQHGSARQRASAQAALARDELLERIDASEKQRAAQRAHMRHLHDDPRDICIPVFNAIAFAPVDLSPTAFDAPHEAEFKAEPGSILARLPATDRLNCVVEIHLRHDSTHARIDTEHLAHHRECAALSCIDVWTTAKQRAIDYGTTTFVLKAVPDTNFLGGHPPYPIIAPVDEHLEILAPLQWAGIDHLHSGPLGRAYEVTPQTAEELSAGRTPTAHPLHFKIASSGQSA